VGDSSATVGGQPKPGGDVVTVPRDSARPQGTAMGTLWHNSSPGILGVVAGQIMEDVWGSGCCAG